MGPFSLPLLAGVIATLLFVCAWVVFQPDEPEPPGDDNERGRR